MRDILAILREQARLRQLAEAISSATTTIGRAGGGTEDASGSSPNVPVPSQNPTDAGQTHANPTVQAEREPGELAVGVRSIHGRAGGIFTAGDAPHKTESNMQTTSRKPVSESVSMDSTTFRLEIPEQQAYKMVDAMSAAGIEVLHLEYPKLVVSANASLDAIGRLFKQYGNPFVGAIIEAGKNDRIGQKTTVGLFAGCFVKVIDKNTNQQVDRGIVRHVHKDKIELKGGDEYDQEHYTFVRIA